ncbi:DUF3986 family protein [Niallia nealsonii]|uniref:DUF3986 domain-containing protein n=1 Tax=Niallia nealsonii TaxID=115979 RepID=A0A2N0Z4C0_9BACI|nr:DUF3986 family protein [Niallia nealsonii]PKG24362.1 hypothetical protein CWS01_07030 [Niallia nealsonii]
MHFDPDQHLHIGYYENGFDLEAVAYKVLGEDKWVIFWPNDQKCEFNKNILSSCNFHPYFGYEIFSIQQTDLSYRTGCNHFADWLKASGIME